METALRNIRNAARPLLFRTSVDEFPISIAGTGFLVCYGHEIFFVTARHVVHEQDPKDIVVLPSDNGKRPLYLIDTIMYAAGTEAEDIPDLAIFSIDSSEVHPKDGARSYVIDLNIPDEPSWFDERFDSKYFFAGYPKAENYVDYDIGIIKTSQGFVPASYMRKSPEEWCHELEINDPLQRESLDGFSGSPVFSVKMGIGYSNQPKFCGMIIRGSGAAGKAYFLEASIVIHALHRSKFYRRA